MLLYALYIHTYICTTVSCVTAKVTLDMCLGAFCMLGGQVTDEGILQMNGIYDYSHSVVVCTCTQV